MFNFSSENSGLTIIRMAIMKWILISYVAAVSAIATAADVDELWRYNDTDIKPLGIGPGWITAAQFDLSKGDNCPSALERISINGKPMCRIPGDSPGCVSIVYGLHALLYNKTMGMVRGYQKGTTDGFQASQPTHHGAGINDAYVDGVSITILQGAYRRHLWTYAAGQTRTGNYPEFNCPCSTTPGPSPPSFVGENYYCSSGAPNVAIQNYYYTNTPLWQGTECTDSKDNCCANVGLPWFYREFPPMTGNMEIRICNSQAFGDESVLIDKLTVLVSEYQQ